MQKVDKLEDTIFQRSNQLDILTISEMVKLANWKLGYKFYNQQLPKKIELLLNTDKQNGSLQKTHKYETRNKKLLNQPLVTTKNIIIIAS